jgi:hypothetical protein
LFLPCSPCCRLCPADDSDGEGTYFETDLKDTSLETPSRWLTDSVSFGSSGLSFSSGYATRCTFIDLTRDSEIEIQVTAATAGSTFAIHLNARAFSSNPFGGTGGNYVWCQHNPPTFVGLRDIAGYVYTGTVTDPGTTNVAYVVKYRYTAGSWFASFRVGGVVAFSDVAVPRFSLENSVFYHGVQGTNDAKLFSRYYMKLTYTS